MGPADIFPSKPLISATAKLVRQAAPAPTATFS
jgi:hypothetical protein